ncbi:MAG: hypothetical protein SYC29_17885 [Planctomycetota bacterium]|nr:hypothetical protein [Planctomycetota bacterium]
MCWIRRTAWEEGVYWNILDGEGILNFGFDDASNGVLFELHGSPADLSVLVPLRDDSRAGKVPVDEWMLIAASFDAGQGRLTGWAQSETVARSSAWHEVSGWNGGEPWPLRLGATATAPAFVGQIGLLVFRDHPIDEADFDAMFNSGAPHYFAPALLETGNMTGFSGIEWMIGHGLVTAPNRLVNANAEGAELGDTVNGDNYLVYNAGDGSDCYSPGSLASVIGVWTLRSPHAPDEPWSGFFARQLPDLGLSGSHYVERISPKARQLAYDTPTGLIRVIVSSNSRGIRRSAVFYGEILEQWALGGVYPARQGNMAGVMVSAGPIWTNWPFMRWTGRTVGTVYGSKSTPLNSTAFGNFGGHGNGAADNFPGYVLAGQALVIEDGSSFIPKAQPESETQFDERTDPVTVRAMLLKFPGSGEVIYLGEKGPWQMSTDFSNEGDPVTMPLDTTIRTYVMSPEDSFDSGALTLTLSGVMEDIEIGHACFISDGTGKDGISMIVNVDTSDGASTVVTLERGFPTDPVPGASTLKFGPVEPVWVGFEWEGLAPDDPYYYRGIRLSASNGIVVVLFLDCFNPEADGFIVGPMGQVGRGYNRQLELFFSENGIPLFGAIEADVWLQLFAQQNSPASCMVAYTDAIRQMSPATEIWWCGDPDFDTDVEDMEGTDYWQEFILDNAVTHDVGAIVAHERPNIGIGFERLADGQVGNKNHASARGCRLYLQEVLAMMRDAALEDGSSCPWDLDDDGEVDTADLLLLLAAWGPCGVECPADFDGDGIVGTSDLLALLSEWGPCE